MKSYPINTERMRIKLENLEGADEYKEFIKTYKNEYVSWEENLQNICKEKKLTEKALRRLLLNKVGFDYKTIKTYLKKAPLKRRYVVWFAICLGLDRDQTDRLLTRHARFYQLYEKDPYDSILIFQLNNGLDALDEGDTLKKQYDLLVSEFETRFQNYQESIRYRTNIPTTILSRQLSHIKNVYQLLAYFDMNMLPFKERNRKLTNYIDTWLSERYLNNLLASLPDDKKNKLNYMVSNLRHSTELTKDKEKSEKTDSKEKEMQRIKRFRNGNKFPSRSSLIILGLSLYMPAKNINDLLLAGGYEPLCPKNVIEGAIICAVEELYITVPAYFSNQPLNVIEEIKKHDDYFDELYSDPEIWKELINAKERKDHENDDDVVGEEKLLISYVNNFINDLQLDEQLSKDTLVKELRLKEKEVKKKDL